MWVTHKNEYICLLLTAYYLQNSLNDTIFLGNKKALFENQIIGSPKKILLVDDDPIAKIGIKTLLDSFGCCVEVASNGLEALNLLKNQPFDLILADICMPKMNGYELTQSIRSSTMEFRDTVIVGISAYVGEEEILMAKEMGMNQVLKKPIDVSLLKRLISKSIKNI